MANCARFITAPSAALNWEICMCQIILLHSWFPERTKASFCPVCEALVKFGFPTKSLEQILSLTFPKLNTTLTPTVLLSSVQESEKTRSCYLILSDTKEDE